MSVSHDEQMRVNSPSINENSFHAPLPVKCLLLRPSKLCMPLIRTLVEETSDHRSVNSRISANEEKLEFVFIGCCSTVVTRWRLGLEETGGMRAHG